MRPAMCCWKLYAGWSILVYAFILTRVAQETDKATIDVEAQEDGILAKIIVGSPLTPGVLIS